MKLRVFARDVGRVWRGLRDYRVEKGRATRLDLGLAYLSVVEPVACRGNPARYRTAVTDLGSVARPVRLVLEFRLPATRDRAVSRAARLVTALTTEPRSRSEVEWRTDGLRLAEARCGERALACELETRPVTAAEYEVVLELLEGSRCVDRIVARQALEPAPG